MDMGECRCSVAAYGGISRILAALCGRGPAFLDTTDPGAHRAARSGLPASRRPAGRIRPPCREGLAALNACRDHASSILAFELRPSHWRPEGQMPQAFLDLAWLAGV